ncbi:unnamed protein product [Adineta steineri]|uniref:Uncharacterized protein n=1 Tax=Adineta steineri TaxID=433720 RepID=A0A813N3M3_9BILA|nr:unnamed protein product [Adineta steineri]CAF4029851.1 unnamed protein product [Adineta steineri]
MASVSTNQPHEKMNQEINRFLDYLLDTDSTSEIAYHQKILEKDDLYQTQYGSCFEKAVEQKLQQWKEFDQEQQTLLNAENDLGDNKSDNESETEEEDEEKEEEEELLSGDINFDQSSSLRNCSKQEVDLKPLEIYINPIDQCKRLLQFLYHCQQNYSHFTDLYFRTLDHCIKNENENISSIALQQIALHLSDDINNKKQRERLIKYLPSKTTMSTISEIHKPILHIIETLLSTNETIVISQDDLDILFPYRARFLDLQREFRDSTHYFIDGDSLLLSIAHHINVDLISYFGNILHVIFIIERILLILFNQTHQCNYTLLFFDCHHQFYQKEKSILTLIRSCLITHLSKNIDKYGSSKVKQFSSWFDEDYKKFAKEEKPHFIFYHDMSSFNLTKDHLLSELSLKQLLYIYRLFGIYHQFDLECHVYLMNKLTLTDTYIKCFQMNYREKCSKKRINDIVQIRAFYQHITINEKNKWTEFEKQISDIITQDDIRVFLYIKTIIDLMEMKKDQVDEEELLKYLSPLLLLHIALLIRLSLIDRQIPSDFPSITFSTIFSQLITQFQQQLALSVSACSSVRSWSKITDLFDGRFFAFTLYQLNQSSSKISFDSDTMNIIIDCLSFLKFSVDKNIFYETIEKLIQSKHLIFSSSFSTETDVGSKSQEIARISNRFIDTYLQPIISNPEKLTFNFVDPKNVQLARYEGKYHWHVYKEVGNEISRIRNNDETFRSSTRYRYRTKHVQQFYTYFTLYGKSLTNRDVRDNHLQIVLPTAPTTVLTDGKKKEKPQKKADKIREDNKQQKMIKRAESESDQLISVNNLLKGIPLDDYSKLIKIIDESLLNFQTSNHRLELLKQKFRFQRKYLQSLRKKTTLTIEETSKLELLQIGYFATMTDVVHLEKIVDVFDKKKKYFEELINHSPLDREQFYRFQMEQINSRLPRREQGTPDNRVVDFIPDEWQVKFLDAVDKRQSIIIVAPTASGKTYASYYAMNKVLKDDNDQHGICGYIAPTKALVNQVAATIHSKFGPVFGIFTRDYRVNMDSCRILVTVPQCMEILLLSLTHQQWCQRIRYAIFDEIHCMSGEIGADVWEKTMLLINCPMIGLSATVNNSDELCQWITNVEKQRSKLFKTSTPRQVCLITHHERVADLNKYLYSNRELYPIHPIGVMNTKQLMTRGIPKDFSLSPRETIKLNDQIKKKQNDIECKPVPSLTEYFSSDWIIERSICNEYSKLVQNQFNHLIDKQKISTIDTIITALQPITSNDVKYPETKKVSSLIVDFIDTLKEKNLLPCIVFSDNRVLCEKMAESVAKHYDHIENDLRETKYKKQIEELKKRLELAEQNRQKLKQKKVSKSSIKRHHDEDNIDEIKMVEEENNQILLSDHEQQLLDGILDEGTLANRQRCDRELADALLERADKDNSRLVSYMRRGVAYHHSGLNNKGRVAVEALFRTRYIQVVFSTATLALGIHMPAKTVAFIQDTIYLDALQYRQASGRAGRRGFDIQGHVIFIDIPLAKISHLMMSAIPNIHAHFPTSVTFLMRLLHLCSNAKDIDDAINRSLIVLQCPLIAQSSMNSQLIDVQTRFHCLFTMDFLYRLNLINKHGQLIGLAGLLTHIHYFEPANILLVYLMDTRLFHQIKDQFEIMTIFTYLFTDMPWLITDKKYEDLTKNRKETKLNSKLFLPPISKIFRQRIDVYNSIVKEVYGCYIETIAQYLRNSNNRHEEILPFSNISFAQNIDYDNGTFEYQLHHHYSQQRQKSLSISPFAALSGLTHEKYMSNYNPIIGSWDLVYDLDLSPKVVPFFDINCCDHTNTAYHLNSYVLDFYKHGSEALIIMENGLNSGDTYNLLLDFHLMLSSIKTSLQVILDHELKHNESKDRNMLSPLYKLIASLHMNFAKKFRRQYPDRNKL